MRNLKTALIATTALTILSLSQACAQQNSESNILNGQVDLNSSVSKLTTSVVDTSGNVTLDSTAGGNAVEIVTMNNTNVQTGQFTGGGADIVSIVNANVQNTDGTVSINSQA